MKNFLNIYDKIKKGYRHDFKELSQNYYLWQLMDV